MAVINKTAGTSVLSLQSVAASTVLISSAQDVSTKLAASLMIFFGRRATTAAGAGVNIRVEASGESSGDKSWVALYTFTTNFATCENEALTSTVSSGQAVLTMANTTNITVGDYLYIDNTTIANSEWGRVKAVSSNTSATIEDNLANAQTSSTIYDSAEQFICQLDLTAISRIRIVVDGASYTQAFAIKVLMVTGDSVS